MEAPRALAAIKSFFVNEYSTDKVIESATNLRDDLWLDDLALEDLGAHLASQFSGLTIRTSQWDELRTVGDVEKLLDSAPAAKARSEAPIAEVPAVADEVIKAWFPKVIDRAKAPRQLEAGEFG